MNKSVSVQIITALAKLTRLKEKEGLLLAVYPDFILAVRPGMDEDERDAAADALLEAAEDLSLPVMEDPSWMRVRTRTACPFLPICCGRLAFSVWTTMPT